MSGRLALVHLAACSAPCCSAAVLQTKHAVPGLAHLSDSLIPSSRGCTLHNRVLLNTAIPAAQRQSCRPNIIQVHVSPHFSVHFCLLHLLSSQSTRHLPALSARCTDFTQAARRRRGSNQAAIGDLNAAAASHVQCCSLRCHRDFAKHNIWRPYLHLRLGHLSTKESPLGDLVDK